MPEEADDADLPDEADDADLAEDALLPEEADLELDLAELWLADFPDPGEALLDFCEDPLLPALFPLLDFAEDYDCEDP